MVHRVLPKRLPCSWDENTEHCRSRDLGHSLAKAKERLARLGGEERIEGRRRIVDAEGVVDDVFDRDLAALHEPECLLEVPPGRAIGGVQVDFSADERREEQLAGLARQANDDDLAAKLTAAGEATGEKVWRLPLGPKYDELIKSKLADMKNIGGRYGGSITAAQFLQRFIKQGTLWAHLDIAGTGMDAADSDINQSWGPGFGVRLLNQMIAETEEK
jgi:hypothetical protein